MPRAIRTEGQPDQLRNYVAGMFTDADYARIQKVIDRYGMKKAAALRYLALKGLEAEEAKNPPKPKE
jgi:hypothetical protein